jgi:hypothetical protein
VVTEGNHRATCTPQAARRAREAIREADAAWTRWYESMPEWMRVWDRANGRAAKPAPSTQVDVLVYVSH